MEAIWDIPTDHRYKGYGYRAFPSVQTGEKALLEPVIKKNMQDKQVLLAIVNTKWLLSFASHQTDRQVLACFVIGFAEAGWPMEWNVHVHQH